MTRAEVQLGALRPWLVTFLGLNFAFSMLPFGVYLSLMVFPPFGLWGIASVAAYWMTVAPLLLRHLCLAKHLRRKRTLFGGSAAMISGGLLPPGYVSILSNQGVDPTAAAPWFVLSMMSLASFVLFLMIDDRPVPFSG